MYSALLSFGLIAMFGGALCFAEFIAILLEKKCPAFRKFLEDRNLDGWYLEDE